MGLFKKAELLSRFYQNFGLLFNVIFVFLLSFESSLCILGISSLSGCNLYFLPVCGFCFHSLNRAFQRAEVLHFDEVQFTNFFFYRSFFFVISKICVPNLRS